MGRILAIDYGDVRIGIAVTDPLKLFAKPFTTLHNNNFIDIVANLKELIDKLDVDTVLLGLPIRTDGEYSDKTRQVEDFSLKLQKEIPIPIVHWDESYSSVKANEYLKKKGIGIMESRQIVDQIAASIFLEEYLKSI